MHQRKQNPSDQPVQRELKRQQQRQAVMQEDQRFPDAGERGEALNRALDMQARQFKEIQRRQGQ